MRHLKSARIEFKVTKDYCEIISVLGFSQDVMQNTYDQTNGVPLHLKLQTVEGQERHKVVWAPEQRPW